MPPRYLTVVVSIAVSVAGCANPNRPPLLDPFDPPDPHVTPKLPPELAGMMAPQPTAIDMHAPHVLSAPTPGEVLAPVAPLAVSSPPPTGAQVDRNVVPVSHTVESFEPPEPLPPSPLVVRNMAFCTEVISYGVHTDVPATNFAAGQQLLLYAEIDDFKSQQSADGFYTALRSRYDIIDDWGRHVFVSELPAIDETCRNQRRDYFVRYFLTLPSDIEPGHYVLQLTVEDTLGHTSGTSSIPMSIYR
jgi:hypothetical protein